VNLRTIKYTETVPKIETFFHPAFAGRYTNIQTNFRSVYFIFIITVSFLFPNRGLTQKQTADSLNVNIADTTMSVADTTLRDQKSDSTLGENIKQKKNPILLRPVEYNLQNKPVQPGDTSAYEVFRFDDILYLNYNGMADVFRNTPQIQIYDFLEMGLPRYVSAYNLLPHQTSLQIDNRTVNDPISGMFNTRFLPLDAVQAVERSAFRAMPLNNASSLSAELNFRTRMLDTEEPYTRLMFRQGDFGYTDLDIIFATKLSKRMNLQLGGINKFYDPNGYEAQNYRGILSYQISPLIYLRTRFSLNREKLKNYNPVTSKDYAYNEKRDDLYADLTSWIDEEQKEQWHIQAAVSGTQRNNQSKADSFLVKNRYEQAQLGISRNMFLGKTEIQAGLSAFQCRVWGTIFDQKYTDSGVNARIGLNYPLSANISLKPHLSFQYLLGDGLIINPGIEAVWEKRNNALSLSAQQMSRFPSRMERFILYPGILGDANLANEKMTAFTASFLYKPAQPIKLFFEAGHRAVSDEIVFSDTNFHNGDKRAFNYFSASADFRFWKFRLRGGGQVSDASVHLSPAASAWGAARFNDVWFDGALVFDAIGSVYWYDHHNEIMFNPVAERFYWTSKNEEGYYIFTWKLTATVGDLQLYASMDNPQNTDYQYISGAMEFYWRIQFGLNWVMWD